MFVNNELEPSQSVILSFSLVSSEVFKLSLDTRKVTRYWDVVRVLPPSPSSTDLQLVRVRSSEVYFYGGGEAVWRFRYRHSGHSTWEKIEMSR